jgi:hypothetical protein
MNPNNKNRTNRGDKRKSESQEQNQAFKNRLEYSVNNDSIDK